MDKGHKELIKDLKAVTDDAEAYEFHDFKGEKYPAPKMQLAEMLVAMLDKVKDGTYDNYE